MNANTKVVIKLISALDDEPVGGIEDKRLDSYQALLNSIETQHSQANLKVKKHLLYELRAMIWCVRGHNDNANKYLKIALEEKGDSREFISKTARQWEVEYTEKYGKYTKVQEQSPNNNESESNHKQDNSKHSPINKKSKVREWVTNGFYIALFLLSFIGLFYMVDSTSSDDHSGRSEITKNSAGEHYEVVQDFINNIDSTYNELVDSTGRLAQDIDEECVWLSDNISEEVGDYCSDTANNNYAFLQGGDWSISDISYEPEDEVNDVLDNIAQQANTAYNNLLSTARETEEAIYEQCGWLEANISYNVGEGCFASINGLGDFSTDPFNASEYYINE